MKLEVRIPISPTPHFFRQVDYLVHSFVLAGGIASRARFVVSVGEDCDPVDLTKVAPVRPLTREKVEWRWANREEFRRLSYTATNLDRLRCQTDADVVLLLDADTMMVSGIDDIVQPVAQQHFVAGVMTHVPPFYNMPGGSWEKVFMALGRPLPPDRYEHSGWGGMFSDPMHRFGPPYFNFGVVFVPGTVLPRLRNEFMRQLSIAGQAPIHPVFSGQLAVTLALCELDIPRSSLPIRYNFPNDDWADRLHLNDLADVRIIHYLRENIIGSRRGTWGDDAAFTAFLQRNDLSGSNEILRRTAVRVRSI